MSTSPGLLQSSDAVTVCVQVCQEHGEAERKARGDSSHGTACTFHSCSPHLLDDGVDDDGDSVDSPRDQSSVKVACTGTDLFPTVGTSDGDGGGSGVLMPAAEQTHSVTDSIINSGRSESSTSDRSQGDEEDAARKHRSISQRRSRSTKAAQVDEVNDGSRSTSSVELRQGYHTFSEGMNAVTSDLESQESEMSMIQIHNMSDHHIKVFSATSSEEALR